MIQAGIDVIHYCFMDVVGRKRQEVGLKWACRLSVVGLCGFSLFKVKVNREITQRPHQDSNLCHCTSEALTSENQSISIAQFATFQKEKLNTFNLVISQFRLDVDLLNEENFCGEC